LPGREKRPGRHGQGHPAWHEAAPKRQRTITLCAGREALQYRRPGDDHQQKPEPFQQPGNQQRAE